jgi:hypothetical protein
LKDARLRTLLDQANQLIMETNQIVDEIEWLKARQRRRSTDIETKKQELNQTARQIRDGLYALYGKNDKILLEFGLKPIGKVSKTKGHTDGLVLTVRRSDQLTEGNTKEMEAKYGSTDRSQIV